MSIIRITEDFEDKLLKNSSLINNEQIEQFIDNTITNRFCKLCDKFHPIEEFFKFTTTLGYTQYVCKKHRRQYEKEYRSKIKNGDIIPKEYSGFIGEDSIENSRLKSTYGIDLHEFRRLLAYQNNCCAICGDHVDELNKKICVDHCHKTGKIRGLLCLNCNYGLGHFKDNIDNLYNAIDYLTCR